MDAQNTHIITLDL